MVVPECEFDVPKNKKSQKIYEKGKKYTEFENFRDLIKAKHERIMFCKSILKSYYLATCSNNFTKKTEKDYFEVSIDPIQIGMYCSWAPK